MSKPGADRYSISVCLDKALHEQLTERAQRMGVSKSAFVRQVLVAILPAGPVSPGRSWELDCGSDEDSR